MRHHMQVRWWSPMLVTDEPSELSVNGICIPRGKIIPLDNKSLYLSYRLLCVPLYLTQSRQVIKNSFTVGGSRLPWNPQVSVVLLQPRNRPGVPFIQI